MWLWQFVKGTKPGKQIQVNSGCAAYSTFKLNTTNSTAEDDGGVVATPPGQG
jgi:hypothetical protein